MVNFYVKIITLILILSFFSCKSEYPEISTIKKDIKRSVLPEIPKSNTYKVHGFYSTDNENTMEFGICVFIMGNDSIDVTLKYKYSKKSDSWLYKGWKKD